MIDLSRTFVTKRDTHNIPPHQIHPRSHPQGRTAASAPHMPWCARSGNVCAQGTPPLPGASNSS